jgi:hypothetical protein
MVIWSIRSRVVGFRGCDILKSVEFNFMDIWQCTPLLCFGVHSGALLNIVKWGADDGVRGCVGVVTSALHRALLQNGDWSTWAPIPIKLEYTMAHSSNFGVHVHTCLFG